MTDPSYLTTPPTTDGAQRLYDDDLQTLGYVMNASRLWAHHPEVHDALFALMGQVTAGQGLSLRQRGILVLASASTLGDSYCSLAWGTKVAAAADPDLAAGVLAGSDEGLTGQERALARWARLVAGDPSATTPADVQVLRDAGFTDPQIFAITTYAALRIAFSTINDALGAIPDAQIRSTAPAAVLEAVTYGRPIAESTG